MRPDKSAVAAAALLLLALPRGASPYSTPLRRSSSSHGSYSPPSYGSSPSSSLQRSSSSYRTSPSSYGGASSSSSYSSYGSPLLQHYQASRVRDYAESKSGGGDPYPTYTGAYLDLYNMETYGHTSAPGMTYWAEGGRGNMGPMRGDCGLGPFRPGRMVEGGPGPYQNGPGRPGRMDDHRGPGPYRSANYGQEMRDRERCGPPPMRRNANWNADYIRMPGPRDHGGREPHRRGGQFARPPDRHSQFRGDGYAGPYQTVAHYPGDDARRGRLDGREMTALPRPRLGGVGRRDGGREMIGPPPPRRDGEGGRPLGGGRRLSPGRRDVGPTTAPHPRLGGVGRRDGGREMMRPPRREDGGGGRGRGDGKDGYYRRDEAGGYHVDW